MSESAAERRIAFILAVGFGGLSLTLASTFAVSDPTLLAVQAFGVVMPAIAFMLTEDRSRGESPSENESPGSYLPPETVEGGDRR